MAYRLLNCSMLNHTLKKDLLRNDLPYNLRGAISANHQISYLEVIFTIIKFANHSVTFCVAG